MPHSHETLSLPLLPGKSVTLDFAGGDLSSDAGLLPLALVDQRLRLCQRLAQAVEDRRDSSRVRHSLLSLFRERVYLIAQGYEDAVDANSMRHDPLLKVALGQEVHEGPLAGQSTLSRFENSLMAEDLWRLGGVLLDLFVERCGAQGSPRPKRIVLDFDPFCDPCHGNQQLQLFNGHYDCHCYLPLYVCGSVDGGQQRIIGVLLREGTAAPVRGARLLLEQIVWALQARFPHVEIIARGDGGFGVPKMLSTCHRLGVKYCFGKPQNERLHALSERMQLRAALRYTLAHQLHGQQQAPPQREYGEFSYAAGSWKKEERMVVKVEVTGEGRKAKLNPRFVVTSLTGAQWSPEQVYAFYCGRGDPENRIKEFKVDLHADRLSCHSFLANQFRLILHTAAYILYQALQEALSQTQFAQAQVGTLRETVMKVAARVLSRCRGVRVQLPSSYPWQREWRALLEGLLPAGP
jgi:hypothetical protein